MDAIDKWSECKAIQDHRKGISLLDSFTTRDNGSWRIMFADAYLDGMSVAVECKTTGRGPEMSNCVETSKTGYFIKSIGCIKKGNIERIKDVVRWWR